MFCFDFKLEEVEEEASVCLPNGTEIDEVAVLYDSAEYVLLKIGEKDIVYDYYKQMIESYTKADFQKLAGDIVYADFPVNQELVNRVIDTTGYLESLCCK